MVDIGSLRTIVEREFSDVVVHTEVIRNKLRVLLSDGSYVDFWWAEEISGRFAHHWERRHIDGTIYRHDNMPHRMWEKVRTFPKHFHDGKQENVRESFLPDGPEEAVREFIRSKLGSEP